MKRQDRKPSGSGRRRRHSGPLSFEERERAEGLARRLQAEFGRLLDALPGGRAGASELARRLGLSRPVCQRVISACEPTGGALGFLVKGPGLEGLAQVIDAAEKAGVPAGRIASARAAASRFGELLADLGGSHSAVARRVRGTVSPSSAESVGADDEETRADLYQAAARITGRHMATLLQITVFRCVPGDPDHFECASAFGQIGAEALPGGMPFVSGFISVSPKQDSEPGANDASLQLEEGFSTQPLPTVTVQDSRAIRCQVIDPDRTLQGRPIDLVVADRRVATAEHPTRNATSTLDAYLIARQPARQLVLDVWIDKALARQSIASASAFLWSPTIEVDLEPRWFDELRPSPRLELLGPKVEEAATPYYSRHVELTSSLLKRLSWDPGALVGHRLSVSYPVWGAAYRVRFQF